MTKLLVSVSGPDEAEVALAGGADFIDLKDPRRGALGAVSPEVLQATIERVAGRRPVSAVAGDLPMDLGALTHAVIERAAADFVKVGLFPASAETRRTVLAGLAPLAARTPLIAVLFADGDPDIALLADLKASGFKGAMLDTMEKSGGGLLRHLSVLELGRFVETCRAAGLMSGLAGSLEAADVPRLVVLKPDYLGFRGALTTGRREDAIDLAAVSAMRALIDREEFGGDSAPGAETDRIFVRDFTLEMEIGAYGFERGRRQQVRFGVEADVARTPSSAGRPAVPSRMGDIYSYDIIMDAVRGLAARGHTDLVETLAEELAALVLVDRRVLAVTVRVEKLELGPAAVGVEIRRGKRV